MEYILTVTSWGVKNKSTGEREIHHLLVTEWKPFQIMTAVNSPPNLVAEETI